MADSCVDLRDNVSRVFILVYSVAKIGGWVSTKDVKRLSVSLVLISFIGIATDALVRVFLLVLGELYMLNYIIA